ncbi:MAG: PA2779 family protein [Pseudomonadota bacterium]|nr:PA2779 family protein [Pseudomonadota bacterium]
MKVCIRKAVCWSVSASFLIVSTSLPAAHAAAGVKTAEAFAQAGIATEQSANRQQVSEFLARADVRDQLTRLGVEPTAAEARVAALTDAEIAQISHRIDQLPAGGESIIGALIFVFLVLLITDILGFTEIFPFTRPVR